MLLVAAGPSVSPTTEPAVALVVAVSDVRDAKGHVLVAVCPSAEFLSLHCPFAGEARAHPGTVTIRIDGIPPGVYAVQAFQDANDNRKVDRNLVGMPIEGIGFSNDAAFHFGPPRFADAAITLGPQGGRIALRLRYYAE